MKPILLCFALALMLQASAQLQKTEIPKTTTVGKLKRGGITMGELSYAVPVKDTLYFLDYDNQEYKRIKKNETVSFKETGGVCNGLYQMFADAMDKAKGEETAFKLGEDDFYIKTTATLGAKVLYVAVTGKGTFNITRKELDRLFNK